ncbi:MAG TPA: hypothetical protein VM434_15715, partial [Beijerinckiaceae bacterium]|nr:hypothetical protein [Beijerinckiaceae bacterium]
MAQPLMIRFATDADGARGAIANLAGSVATNMTTVAGHMRTAADEGQRFTRMVQAVPRLVVPFSAAIAAIAALAAVIRSARAEFEELLKIEQRSARAGFSADFGQAFIKAAHAMRMETEGAFKAMEAAGDAVAFKFDRVPPVLELATRLFGEFSAEVKAFLAAPTAESRVAVVLEQVKQLRQAGQELAALNLAEALMGREFADNLRQGRVNLDAVIAGTKEAAAAQGDHARRAQELVDRLADAQKKIGDFFAIQYSLVELGFGLKQTWVVVNEAIAETLGWLERVHRLMQDILALKPPPAWNWSGEIGPPEPPKPAPPPPDPMAAARAQLGRGLQSGAMVERAQRTAERMAAQVRPDPRGGGDSRTDSIGEVERYIRALERANAMLEAEAKTLGMSAVEREKAIVLARAEIAAKH